MQVHISQHRRDQTALRRSPATVHQFPVFHDFRNQKPFHIPQKVLVLYVMLQKLHQPVMIHIVKEAFNVSLQDVIDIPIHNRLINESDHIVAASTRSKSIGARQKSTLIDFAQYICHHALYESILISWYTKGTQLAIVLRNICPSNRQRSVLEFLHPLHQIMNAFHSIDIVTCFVNAINSGGFLPVLLLMLFHECPLVDKVHQVLHFFPMFRLVPYSCCFCSHCLQPPVPLSVSFIRNDCLLPPWLHLLSQISSLLCSSPTSGWPSDSLRFLSLVSPYHPADGTSQISQVCMHYFVCSSRSKTPVETMHPGLTNAYCCLLWRQRHRLPL
jgi:hypothetical protein